MERRTYADIMPLRIIGSNISGNQKNLGPAASSVEVLKNASGQFFMWLGDDDWIDPAYISSRVQQLMHDPTTALDSVNPEILAGTPEFLPGHRVIISCEIRRHSF